MKIAFKIPPGHDHPDLHLLAEAGKDEISFLLYKDNPMSLQGFYTYSFNKHISDTETADFIREIIHKEPVLQQAFLSCKIFYNQKECTVIPADFFSEGEKHRVCDLMFGEDRMSFSFTETVKNEHTKLVYRVPSKVHESLKEAFPSAVFSHAASCRVGTKKHRNDILECIVYHNTVKLLLFKQGDLQLLQYAEYTVPADICYYLLHSCRQFEVEPGTVQLVLSGMVDEHSNLYNEIYRYFLNVVFLPIEKNVEVAGRLNAQPHHFYSHLSSLIQCV